MSGKPLLYSYVRFSTNEQAKGNSLKRQLDYAKKIAEARGLHLDESLTMRDLGLSAFTGANITKGAFGTFLRAIEAGKVPAGSILLIESLDRLSRQAVMECVNIATQIINAGVTIITAIDKKEYNKHLIDENPSELFTMLSIFIRANEESETKSKRVRDAFVEQCELWLAGDHGIRITCGTAPKWVKWDKDSKMFVFDPLQKQIMLRKIELFKQGLGGLRIAEALNNEFGAGTIHHTAANVYKEMRRRNLVGELSVSVGDKEYVLPNYYPALMTHIEFDNLISDSTKRGATKHSQKFVGILSGIGVFKCGCCGGSVGSHVTYRGLSIDDVPKGNKRYGCVEARRNNNCKMKSTIQLDVIEAAIVRFCQDNVNLKRILSNQEDRECLLNKESELKSRLHAGQKNIEIYLDAMLTLDGEPPKAVLSKIKTLETEADEINRELIKNRLAQSKIENRTREEVAEKWLTLTRSINRLDNDARLSLRQLAKDTFQAVTLSVDLSDKDDLDDITRLAVDHLMGQTNSDYFDLTLEFHNGKKRLLRLHKYTGELIAGFDLN
ncbi:recombinase family protein [Vibrio cholerae]